MVIDEKKEYILTNFQSARGVGKATNSDHFTEYIDLDLQFVSERPEHVDSQNLFNRITSETEEFTNCFHLRGGGHSPPHL